jgi:hypothetical protein
VKNGLKAKVRPRKWLISPINKEARLAFALEYLGNQIFDWRKVIFSDESQIECGLARRTVRNRTSEEALLKFPLERERRGCTLRVWGAIFPDGKKILTFYDKQLVFHEELFHRLKISDLVSFLLHVKT